MENQKQHKKQLMKQLKKALNFLTIISILSLTTFCQKEPIIVDKEIKVSSIEISGASSAGDSNEQYTAIVKPENASNKTVQWSTSDASIATINQSGQLTPKTNGVITITAKATDGSNIKGIKSVQISGITVLVSSITIEGASSSIGGTVQLSALISPSNASNKAVSWSVEDTSIITVDENGLITPVANGNTTVTATAQDGSGIETSIEFTVSGMVGNVDGVVVDNSNDFISTVSAASAGDKIYVKGGTYVFNSTISINNSGTAANKISILPFPDDSSRPLFDFSAMSENSSNRGIKLNGDYWHIKGIDIKGAGDNGMFISGHYNTIEFMSFYENKDSGLQIGNGGSNNTILNCDSYYNADSSLENADGFAAKLDVGTGNKFIGCRAWQNLDDGWDGYLRGSDNISTYHENCWAFNNGYLKNGSVTTSGDGNGFKTGGSDDKTLKHNATYYNCIAVGNTNDGFDHNSNRGTVAIYNSGAYKNKNNINFSTTNIAASLTIKNTVSFEGTNGDRYDATSTDVSNNSWQNGLSATSADYKSLSIELLSSPRQADGSLPNIDFMKLVDGSDLIDKGVDVGKAFTGSAPDIGPFEKN